jgi:hypothetical protein
MCYDHNMSYSAKYFISNLVNDLCWFVVSFFPDRCDKIHENDEPYLLRLHIKRCGKLRGLYLHHFYKSDEDRDLHNHPWENSASLIICGSYEEERINRNNPGVRIRKLFKPGMINNISADDFHKVTLKKTPVWTLFTTKKQCQTWGFWSEKEQRFIPYSDYLVDNDGTYVTNLLGVKKELAEK